MYDDKDEDEDADEDENENDFMITPSGMVHFVGKTDRTGLECGKAANECVVGQWLCRLCYYSIRVSILISFVLASSFTGFAPLLLVSQPLLLGIFLLRVRVSLPKF